MPKKNRKKEISISQLLSVPDGKTCTFCLRNEDKEEEYGKFIKKCGLQVHYFCMLFASGLCQRGKTEESGIFGFLPQDIIKEIRRGSRLRCSYCKMMGGTIGCVISTCSRKFHLGCGRQNGTLHQFFGSFRSFCQEHRPRQMVPISDRLAFYGTANAPCAICMNSVEARASNETLRAPCCRNSWFHRNCIQKHASTAGLYFFKCPLCNNKEMFQNEMLEFGIYIPDQDAAWETEPNAYNELMERYSQCDALLCRCPNGRKYNRDGGKWEILTCDWCGSKGTHDACHSLIKIGRNLVCQDCKEIDDRSKKLRKEGKKKRTPIKKRLCAALEKKQEIDLEQKGKSEYPGPSASLIKPDQPQLQVMSPGMILRLSYQETDDEVDVVEDDSDICLSPLTSIQKENKSKSASLGSFEEQNKRRRRARHRKRSRSRSSSSEYIPLSSVQRRLKPESRSKSSYSKTSNFKRKKAIALSDTLNNGRLRSASRGRKRQRLTSLSEELCINNRLRSSSQGRFHRSSSREYQHSRVRSASCSRKQHHPSVLEAKAKRRPASHGRIVIQDEIDEVDGGILEPQQSKWKRIKHKQLKHPFSRKGYQKRRKSTKKMLISMEPDLSELSPVAQYPYSEPQIITDSSDKFDSPLKTRISTPKSQLKETTRSTPSAKSQFNSKSLETEAAVPMVISDTKAGVQCGQSSKNAARQSTSPQENIFSTLCTKQSSKSTTQSQPKHVKKYKKKKYQVDSKQLLINQWLKTSKDCKNSNKENNQSKFLTIEYHGKKFIKMVVETCGENDKMLSAKTSHVITSPNTRSSILKNDVQSSPNTRSALLNQSPVATCVKSPLTRTACITSPATRTTCITSPVSRTTCISSPVTRNACITSPVTRTTFIATPVTRTACITVNPGETIKASPHSSFISGEVLVASVQKLSEKKTSLVKNYPFRNTPKKDNGNVRCSLTSKFVENNSMNKNEFPLMRSVLEEHCCTHNTLQDTEGSSTSNDADQCMIVEMEEINCSSSEDTIDYMDDDFLTSDDSEDKDTSIMSCPYVIKTYNNVAGLEQVKIVLPGS